jgi:hypothetical protein
MEVILLVYKDIFSQNHNLTDSVCFILIAFIVLEEKNGGYYFYKSLKYTVFLILHTNTGEVKELAIERVLIKHRFVDVAMAIKGTAD